MPLSLSGRAAMGSLVPACLILLLPVALNAQQRPTTAGVKVKAETFAPDAIERGRGKFRQSCAFCHGPDAGGGESGPDLTHSGTVADDVHGNKIGEVVRNGLPNGMPKFNVSDQEVADLSAFLHTQAVAANSDEAQRRKIGLNDLLTGDAAAGKAYFNGKGQCHSCHSPTGDLEGVAKRYDAIKLETRMLYPEGAHAKVRVTTPSGESISGTLAHADEFVVALRDASGWYHSWPTAAIKYQIDAPAEAHVKLLPQLTDADVHNLFAYLNTLR